MRAENIGESEHGFTVLEAIIAFAVLSLALLAVNQTIGVALTSLRKAEELRQVREVADEVLATASSSGKATGTASSGARNGMRWEYRSGPLPDSDEQSPSLRRIKLDVFSPGGRRLRSFVTFVRIDREN